MLHDNFPIGDGRGVNVQVDDGIVALEILIEASLDGVAKFVLLTVDELDAGCFRELGRDFAPAFVAVLLEIDEESADFAMDQGGAEFHSETLCEIE